MSKYKKHYMSKYKYPTKVVKNGTVGTLVVGHKSAQRDLESKLKRPLHSKTTIRTRGGNWVFMEPKNVQATAVPN